MKTWKFLCLSGFVMISAGCQKPHGGSGQGGTVFEYEKSPVRNRNLGGADTGGGAGVGGRMLEEYRTKLTDLPEFTEFVEPLIRRLAEKDADFAADLMHIAVDRTWYILPTDLAKIPPSEMVASISQDKVQQIAVQTEAEVWIDKRHFSQLTATGRVELIVHELVMGVRMMQFQEPFDHCLAEATGVLLKGQDKLSEYQAKRRACAVKKLESSAVGGSLVYKRKKLSNADYNSVRAVTIALLNKMDELSAEEMTAFREVDLKRD